MSSSAHVGWDVQPLGKIAESRRGITYSSEMLESEAEGLLYINMKSFRKGGGFNPEGTKRYAGIYAQSDLIGERDLLVANTDVTAGDIVGAPALLPQELKTEKALYSHHVTRLRLNGDVTDTFLYYLLCLPEYRSHMLRIARGTTVLMLDMQAIKRIPIRAPKSDTEQRHIAEILTTLDKTIEQTEALIAKYQQIKAGLMHDLFTRGVTPDGRLRPTRDEAPHLYKQSPLGWIPKEWEPSVMSKIADLFVGFAFKSEWFQGEGISLLRGENVGTGRPLWNDRQCLSEERAKQFPEYLLKPGDVVIGMDRTFTTLGVKITQLANEDCPALLVQRVGKFVPLQCEASFLRWLVGTPYYLRELLKQQKGMDIPHLSKAEILAPRVVLPPKLEQLLISERIDRIARKIALSELHLHKLQQEKHGLMHDLLTGRVRVKVPEAVA